MNKPSVVVAGGSGFIGAYVVRQLLEFDYPTVIADLQEPKHTYKIEFRKVDLRDESSAVSAFNECEICVCLAARSSGIGYFNEHSAGMLDDNLRILSSSFRAAVSARLRRMLYVVLQKLNTRLASKY